MENIQEATDRCLDAEEAQGLLIGELEKQLESTNWAINYHIRELRRSELIRDALISQIGKIKTELYAQ